MDTLDTTTDEQPTALALTPDEYTATVARIDKINTRAAKRGFTGHFTVTGTPETRTNTNDLTGLTTEYVVILTTITGEAPCYGGWTFLAAVDALPAQDGEPRNFVLRCAPGVTDEDIDRGTLQAGRCDHCHTDRANRTYTYLVRNTETGETLQVGSTCIRDFLGWEGRPVFLSTDEVTDQLDDLGYGDGPRTYTANTLVGLAYAAVQVYGWASASNYSHTPTSQIVHDYLDGTTRAASEIRADLAPHVEAARELAPTIIATVLDNFTDDFGYQGNLTAALTAAFITRKQFALVVSTVAAYNRIMEVEARAAAKANDRASIVHQGTVGEKITVTGTVTLATYIESLYHPGGSYLVVVENETTCAKMFTTARWVDAIDVKDTVTITGTVKTHETYRDTAQTVLVRPKQITE